MFARYFVELQIPADELEHALSRDPREWLPGLAQQANFKGDRLLAEVGLGETIRLHRKVIIELGPPVPPASSLNSTRISRSPRSELSALSSR